MPHFLTQVAYNEQAWQSLVSNPQNRLDAIRPVIDKLGGRSSGRQCSTGAPAGTRAPDAIHWS